MKDGIYPGLTYEQYDAIDAVRWTTLREMAKSPRHYLWRKTHPLEPTDALRVGIGVHVGVLEPWRFPSAVAVWDGGKRDLRIKAWRDFVDTNADKTILTEDQHEAVQAMVAAVLADPVARRYMVGGEAEVVVVWTDRETGLRCKGRIDLAQHRRRVVDIKSARDLDVRLFGKSAANLGYHTQVTFYSDGLAQLVGAELELPLLVGVEKTGPYDVVVDLLDEETVAIARDEYRHLLTVLADCIARDSWLGRAGGVERTLQLPAWVLDDGSEDDSTLDELGLEGAEL